jgi:DNA-binding winged helix-turn-helix (wHTH) protein
VIPNDVLTDTAWRGVALTANSLDHALSALRRALTLPVSALLVVASEKDDD